MRKFIKEIKKEINNLKFGPISTELKNLTIIKFILVKLSRICSRDDRFFLYKENLTLRRKIYNRKLRYNKKNIKVSCKSFCCFIQEILNKLEIRTLLFSPGEDEFRHYVLIYSGQSNNYIIDPLLDLVNFKIYNEARFFCSEYEKFSNIRALSKYENDLINSIIKYKPNDYDDILQYRKINKDNNVLDFLLSKAKESMLFSVSDLVIYLNKAIDDAIKELKDKISISYCLAYKKIKKQQNHKSVNKNDFGVYISYNKQKLYIFPNSKDFTVISGDLEDFIYVKTKIKIRTFQNIKNIKANRQILDNIYFQKVFSEIERKEDVSEDDISIDKKGNIYLIKHEIRFSIYKNRYLLIQTPKNQELVKVRDFGRKILIKKSRIRDLKPFGTPYKPL